MNQTLIEEMKEQRTILLKRVSDLTVKLSQNKDNGVSQAVVERINALIQKFQTEINSAEQRLKEQQRLNQ